jgi:hypothetical protein
MGSVWPVPDALSRFTARSERPLPSGGDDPALPHQKGSMMKTGSKLAALGLTATLGLGACASGGGTSDAASATTAPTATVTETDASSSTDFAVNDASEEEIAAVLTAAGVPSADQWAREVVEYRPYDTSDPDMTHLRDELAKYNPSAEVVDQIVAALQG